MTVRIEPLSDELAPAWDAFVEACPQATFFHRAGWKSVIDRSFGHPTYFVCARRGNEVVGVLPLVHVKSMLFGNALISNAFCVAGGPVASDDEALSHLIAYAAKTLESVGADYVELRDLAVCPPGWKRRAATHATFARDIAADEAANLKQIPRKQRAVVRKAIANDNLTFDLQDDLKTFYGLFALSMRNHVTPFVTRAHL